MKDSIKSFLIPKIMSKVPKFQTTIRIPIFEGKIVIRTLARTLLEIICNITCKFQRCCKNTNFSDNNSSVYSYTLMGKSDQGANLKAFTFRDSISRCVPTEDQGGVTGRVGCWLCECARTFRDSVSRPVPTEDQSGVTGRKGCWLCECARTFRDSVSRPVPTEDQGGVTGRKGCWLCEYAR